MKISHCVIPLFSFCVFTWNSYGCSSGEPFVPDIESIGDTEPFPSRFGSIVEGGGEKSGYSIFDLTIGGQSYNVQTNPWGGADQIIRAGGGNVFEVIQMIPPGGGNDWDVAAYPSVYKGTDQGGNSSSNSGMPIAIGNIASVRTGLSTNTTSIPFKGNTTYDVYFTKSGSFSGGSPDEFLMVWFDASEFNPLNGEDGYNCGGRPPIYIDACSNQDRIEVSGKLFYRFFGNNGQKDVISYVSAKPMDAWEFDLKYFIDDAVAHGYLDPNMYLVSIQAGFEMVEGGEGLRVKDFYADVQSK